MPMRCIAGTFRIVGSEPDGDSIRFYPDDPSDWELVPGPHTVRMNAQGGAQLRLDAVDALETHYTPKGGQRLHQPLRFAHRAARELVRWLGFRDVVRDEEAVVSATPDRLAGYVLTRSADMYGRCVALVGRADAPAASGANLQVGVQLLRRTANSRLVTAGLAYPTFYSKLYVDLRRELVRQVQKARPSKGLWPSDLTQTGTDVADLQTVTDQAVMMPKLFRRLVDYLHLNHNDPSLAGFKRYLAERDDRLLVVSTGHLTGFDTIVDVQGQTLRLTAAPEDLVFQER
jgi:hypothetical protein